MHKPKFALAILIAFGASLTLFGNTAAAQPAQLTACQKKLDSHKYQCEVQYSSSDTVHHNECLTASASGEETFGMDFLGVSFVCECDATGEPGDADFNDSPNKFICGGVQNVCVAVSSRNAFRGEISGKNLKGQGITDVVKGGPVSFIATCEQVNACEM